MNQHQQRYNMEPKAKENYQELDDILSPLGFQPVKLGVYVQPNHPWIQFDLTAVEVKPEIVIPYIMDALWDIAVAEGKRRQQAAFRDMLGIK